jgi:hypothetical protein
VTRLLALLVAFIPAVTLALAEDQPQRNQAEKPDSFDVEPPILKKNLSDDRSATAAAGAAVERLQKKLEEAKEHAKGVERLCKIGVLSKVEMEQRLLKVIQCEAELASARLADAKEKVVELESGVASGESSSDQLASDKAALKQLTEAAEAATAKRKRAELEAGEANVLRQQKLLKLGTVGEPDVDRAVEELAELKAQKN